MDRADIRDGITLFQYSTTGQQGGRAKDLIRVLQNLYQQNAIFFRDLGPESMHGKWSDGTGHLRVNTNYMNSLPSTMKLGALSLLLVHEGIHATVNFAKFYDELAARILPIHYFRELSGPGVFNEAGDPPRPGRRTGIIRCPPGSLPYFDQQDAALRKDQLVDYLFSIDTYRKKSYITPQWVLDNLNNWRGLANRLPYTRGFYIRVLTRSTDSHFTRAILDIMESVRNRADWDAMMENAGSLRAIQVTLDDLGAEPRFSGRIAALERRWGVHLLEDPPAR